MFATAAALALSTLISEDLACVAAGVLIARGEITPAVGVAACVVGIFAGDCGLWALGRYGRRLIKPDGATAARWITRHAALLIVGSRFAPGTRLPLYVSAGVIGFPFGRFALWSGVAVSLWTPAVVLASAGAGAAADPATAGGLWMPVAALFTVLALGRGAPLLGRWAGARWRRLTSIAARLRRWEFWPSWLFYAPVAIWIGWLALRHGGLRTLTMSNPGLQDGGLVGESKADILDLLPADVTIPHRRLDLDALSCTHIADAVEGAHATTAAAVASVALRQMSRSGWSFPVVLKPDVGQRGVGVRIVRSREQLRDYLSSASGSILVQPFHDGPFEAGVFYYRLPHEPRGRIFSITDKQFPVVIGDGTSTLRELIERHPRYRLQSRVFFARHAARLETTPARGERVQLAMAGNHAQGTMFKDGWHLWTPALEERIDRIAREVRGFFIGRFDIRYADVEAFKAGLDLAIVELNGATAESTNIYDPDCSLLQAYRVLCRQWSLVFAIGAMNRARGAAPTPIGRAVRLVLTHLTSAPAHAISD